MGRKNVRTREDYQLNANEHLSVMADQRYVTTEKVCRMRFWICRKRY
jgi:hypothetical protein